MLEKSLEKLQKRVKAGDKEAQKQTALSKIVLSQLYKGKKPLTSQYTQDEHQLLKNLQLLTYKPTLYVANLDDLDASSQHLEVLRHYLGEQNEKLLEISASLEADIMTLPEAEREDFLKELGLQETGLNRLIRAAYDLLGLQTFFTAGPKEVRAWTIKQGGNALDAAGVIHTDFIKHFIRAEVISYDDVLKLGSDRAARQKGFMRLEGKEYVLADGDIICFRTSC